MDTTIHFGNQRRFTVNGIGPNGEPEPLDLTTPLVFDNLTGCTAVQASDDPASFFLVPDQTVGAAFSAQVTADADTGAGNVPVFGVINGTVIPNLAVNLGFGEGAESPIGSPT